MAAGGGLGNLIPLLLTAGGILTMLRAWRRRKGPPEVDDAAERRQADRAETERRMAAYIASRDHRG
jgi:hypothetical protein